MLRSILNIIGFVKWHYYIKDGSVVEMNMENNQVTQIYSAATDRNWKIIEACSQPSYSRDGKYIMFAKGANTFITATTKTFLSSIKNLITKQRVETERQHLFLMNANGTGLTQLRLLPKITTTHYLGIML
jgi:Tol biopolymer transport system component